jgi:hypothetical protein
VVMLKADQTWKKDTHEVGPGEKIFMQSKNQPWKQESANETTKNLDCYCPENKSDVSLLV